MDWLNKKIDELVDFAYERNSEGIKAKLKEIVPEYQPSDVSDQLSSDNFQRLTASGQRKNNGSYQRTVVSYQQKEKRV